MKRTYSTLFLFLISNIGLTVCGQDIHFSQFYMSPLTQNPALAGVGMDLQAIVNYRDQWRSVTPSGTVYRTIAGSLDMRLSGSKVKKGFFAGGVSFFDDKAGLVNLGTTQANLTAAYHVRITDDHTLGAGIQGGFAQKRIQVGGLQWGNQYDGQAYNPNLASGELTGSPSFYYVDAGAGLVWNYDNKLGERRVTDNHDFKANIGVSLFHPHQPSNSFYGNDDRLHMKFVFHGDGVFSINDTRLAFMPGFVYYRQGPAQEIYAGSLIRYKLKQQSKYTGYNKDASIAFGSFIRFRDAISLSMLLKFSKYAIGISYDINTSKLVAASKTNGGFEITLRFTNPSPFMYKKGSARF